MTARTPAEIAAEAIRVFRNCEYPTRGERVIAAFEQQGFVVVPKAALDWLNGEAPDADGKWFGECRDAGSALAGKYPRRYWWRSKFRAMLSARPQDGGGT